MTLNKDKVEPKKPFTIAELQVWQPYIEQYFIDLLNDEETLEELIDSLKSFRNTKYYTGDDEEFKLKPNKKERE